MPRHRRCLTVKSYSWSGFTYTKVAFRLRNKLTEEYDHTFASVLLLPALVVAAHGAVSDSVLFIISAPFYAILLSLEVRLAWPLQAPLGSGLQSYIYYFALCCRAHIYFLLLVGYSMLRRFRINCKFIFKLK